MKSENALIGIFVKKTRILSFLEFLRYKLGINIRKVYVYTVEGNDCEYLVTFSTSRKNSYLSQLHDFTILHIKSGCLFSINALNIYINDNKKEQTDNAYFKVDWLKLQNTLMITANDKLKIYKIRKLDDKYTLFSDLLD